MAGNFSAALSSSTKRVRSAKAEAVVVAVVVMAEDTEAVADAEVTAEAVVAAVEGAAAVVTAATGNPSESHILHRPEKLAGRFPAAPSRICMHARSRRASCP